MDATVAGGWVLGTVCIGTDVLAMFKTTTWSRKARSMVKSLMSAYIDEGQGHSVCHFTGS